MTKRYRLSGPVIKAQQTLLVILSISIHSAFRTNVQRIRACKHVVQLAVWAPRVGHIPQCWNLPIASSRQVILLHVRRPWQCPQQRAACGAKAGIIMQSLCRCLHCTHMMYVVLLSSIGQSVIPILVKLAHTTCTRTALQLQASTDSHSNASKTHVS